MASDNPDGRIPRQRSKPWDRVVARLRARFVASSDGSRENWTDAGNATARPSMPTQPTRSAGESAEIIDRASRIQAWWGDPSAAPPGNAVGLALSGGGIRSATFSLGLIQALARQDKLRKIDVLSTVSGGSYIGCFLRSLFLPAEYRGIAPPVDVPRDGPLSVPEDRAEAYHRFATETLTSNASQRDIEGPAGRAVRNPIWWLREHSRYLAPNGATDYGYVAAVLVRNWIAMIYVFAVAVGLLLVVTTTVEGGLRQVIRTDAYAYAGNLVHAHERVAQTPSAVVEATPVVGCLLEITGCCQVSTSVRCGTPLPQPKPAAVFGRWLSPLFILAALPLLLAVGLGISYWLTVQMSVNERSVVRQSAWFFAIFAPVLLIEGSIAGLYSHLRPEKMQPFATLLLRAGLWLIALELVIGLIAFIWTCAALPQREMLTADLRNRMTEWQAMLTRMAMIIAALGLVETTAAFLRQEFWAQSTETGLGISAALPIFAFIIKKLREWAQGSGATSALAGRISSFLPAIALSAGILLYGTVAVIVGAVVQAAMWVGDAWISEPDWWTFYLMALIMVTLALLTGRATGFINLSSLHNFYASRLTRAYLGASNIDRLETMVDKQKPDATIRDNHVHDYIQPEIYGRLVLPAPLHVINMTLNCTVDLKSQIVARDRKGLSISMEPGGIYTNGDHEPLRPWEVIDGVHAQSLSLGQWCAISGAAASTGMGKLTSLGYALAMSFANVRLGVWWLAPSGCTSAWKAVETLEVRMRQIRMRVVSMFFETFVYLWNEMTARYSRSYDRQYLSDGGHFENLGAYTLIRRDVPLILVSDNGQDEDYAFSDLENLIRLVRLDLGGEMRLLGGDELREFCASTGCVSTNIFVDPESHPCWREEFARKDASGFALVFEIEKPFEAKSEPKVLRLILLKPRMQPNMPEDLRGYARMHPAFPQQSTGDQFFDEAQWESYRRLGEESMSRLLSACPALLKH